MSRLANQPKATVSPIEETAAFSFFITTISYYNLVGNYFLPDSYSGERLSDCSLNLAFFTIYILVLVRFCHNLY